MFYSTVQKEGKRERRKEEEKAGRDKGGREQEEEKGRKMKEGRIEERRKEKKSGKELYKTITKNSTLVSSIPLIRPKN